jgi:iron(III) transport system substrate-binding protein
MSDAWRRFKEDLASKTRELLDRWRALPKGKQWQIAGGLSAAAALSLTAAVWSVLARSGAAHAEDVHTDVVLYTSVDSNLVAPIVAAFKDQMGITVNVVGDTEATKTTGLVARLLAERGRPKADVWWSSEPLGSVTLAQSGLLEPFVSKAEMDFKDGWPKYLRAKDKTWYGFAQRARVIAFNTNRLVKMNVPTKLRELTNEKWRGKVGMARPQFGTTRTHIATLVAMDGEAAVREWVAAMLDNGLKLYDGNSAVVTALSNGEIELGLTDSDDVFAAQREHMPVDMVFESLDKANPAAPLNVGAVVAKGLPSVGPLVIPNTVGKIKGCPHPNEAGKLADFLLSATTESMLAESDSHNIPIRSEIAKKFDQKPIPDPAQVDAGEVALALPQADRLIKDLFPLQ